MVAFERLLKFFEAIVDEKANNESISAPLRLVFPKTNNIEAFLGILSLLDEAIDIVLKYSAKREIAARHAEILQDIKIQYAKQGPNVKRSELKSMVQSRSVLSLISLIKDALDSAGYSDGEPINRLEFIESTVALMDYVQQSDAPEYLKKATALSLDMIIKLSTSDMLFTDEQIRKRVKEVICDFTIAYRKMDRDYEEIWEKILRWSGYAITPGVLLLGVTADVTGIAGYLEDKS